MRQYPKLRSVVVGSGIPDPETDNEMFKDDGFAFEAFTTRSGSKNIRGPLCTQCLQPIPVPENVPNKTKCHNSSCSKEHEYKKTQDEYRSAAHEFYNAIKRTHLNFINWDSSKTEVDDGSHKIVAYFTNRDGKKLAIIHIIGKDNTGRKVQFFVEPDPELIRHDPTDIPPENILAKATFEFKKSKHDTEYD